MLLDLSHTSHSGARTGIQRVCRALHEEWVRRRGGTAILWDPYREAWRPLLERESATLAATRPTKKRGARWSWSQRLQGRWAKFTREPEPDLGNGGFLLVPEVFSPAVARSLSRLFGKVDSPRVAVFHDAIALRLPELSPPGTVARFPGYLQELTQFDAVAAVSEDSRQSLLEFWQWSGVAKAPPVFTVPLGIDAVPLSTQSAVPPPRRSERLGVLCVSSLEGRKNHLALLEACERLWREGLVFDLHLIGLLQPQTGLNAKAKIDALQAAGHPVRYDGPVDEATLEEAYRNCDFTVYPSLLEGFGLPVLESLRRGRPCVCTHTGAIGESAKGGGCLTVPEPTVDALSEALRRMLSDEALRSRLQGEATRRTYRSWKDYADDIERLVADLRVR